MEQKNRAKILDKPYSFRLSRRLWKMFVSESREAGISPAEVLRGFIWQYCSTGNRFKKERGDKYAKTF